MGASCSTCSDLNNSEQLSKHKRHARSHTARKGAVNDEYDERTELVSRYISTDNYDSPVPSEGSGSPMTLFTPAVTVLNAATKQRRRYFVKMIKLNRYGFRECMGMEMSIKLNEIVDRKLGRLVHSYGDWIEYPKGIHELHGHTKAVIASAVSSDGLTLYTGSADQNIIAWDLLSNQLTHKWIAAAASIYDLAYHPPNILISAGKDCCIRIWNAQTFAKKNSLKGHTKAVLSVDLNSEGTRIVSSSADTTVRVWSVGNGQCVGVLKGHSGDVTAARYVGSLIVSGSADKTVRVWNPAEGKQLRMVEEGIIKNPVNDVAVNCDGSLIACMCENETLVLSWPELKIVRTLAIDSCTGVFHPCKPLLLAVTVYESGDEDDSQYPEDYVAINVFDVGNGECIVNLDGHMDNINSIAFTPDGSRLISTSDDRTAHTWVASAN